MKLMEINREKTEDPLCGLYQIESECTSLEREALSLVRNLLDDIEDSCNLKENIKTRIHETPSVQGKIALMLQTGMKGIIQQEKSLKEYL